MKIYYTLISISLILAFSCISKKESPLEIIKDFNIFNIEGETVIIGDTDLTISNDMIITDSLCVLVDLSQSGKIFRSYDLYTFEKKLFWGDRGFGPEDFFYPISFNSININQNTFEVFDSNNIRASEIYATKDSVSITKSNPFPAFTGCFNINRINSDIYLGTKVGEESKGIYFIYNSTKDSLSWIEYSSIYDKDIPKEHKYKMYYNTLCASEKGIVVSLRYFNKVLFYDKKGDIIKEVQLGNEALYPKWDKKEEEIDFNETKTYLMDMCITENHIYCLWIEDDEEANRKKPSKIFVFDWDLNYKSTLQLDKAIVRINASQNDSFILGIIDDGTGLTNVTKYNLPEMK